MKSTVVCLLNKNKTSILFPASNSKCERFVFILNKALQIKVSSTRCILSLETNNNKWHHKMICFISYVLSSPPPFPCLFYSPIVPSDRLSALTFTAFAMEACYYNNSMPSPSLCGSDKMRGSLAHTTYLGPSFGGIRNLGMSAEK